MLAGNIKFAEVRANLPYFDGLRTIEHAMHSMFEDMDFTFLNGFELLSIGPCKYRKEVEKDAVNTTNKAISGFLEQKNHPQQKWTFLYYLLTLRISTEAEQCLVPLTSQTES